MGARSLAPALERHCKKYKPNGSIVTFKVTMGAGLKFGASVTDYRCKDKATVDRCPVLALVQSASEGSLFKRAGGRAGDILLGIADCYFGYFSSLHPLGGAQYFRKFVGELLRLCAGRTVEVCVWRGGSSAPPSRSTSPHVPGIGDGHGGGSSSSSSSSGTAAVPAIVAKTDPRGTGTEANVVADTGGSGRKRKREDQAPEEKEGESTMKRQKVHVDEFEGAADTPSYSVSWKQVAKSLD